MWSVQRVSNQRHPPGWRAFCLLNYARKMRLAALSGSASFPRFGSPAVLRRLFYPCGVRWRPCKVSSLCIRPSSFSGASVSGPAWPVGISHHRRETVAVLGLPPSRAGRLGFRFGCGRCCATWPPRCWSAFYHLAAVLGRCFLPFSAVFVPLWFQNVTQRLIFFASHPKKRRAFLAPCRGRPQGVPFGPALASFYHLPELSRPCCRQLAVMRRLLGRLSAWGFGRGSRRTRERSLKAA